MSDIFPVDWTGQAPPVFASGRLPRHVAVVMDGNGRWANKHGLPRIEGHRAGESALLDVVAGAIQARVKILSLYVFSTENWRRSPEEIRFLLGFNRDVLKRRRPLLHHWGVRLRWSGSRPKLWSSLLRQMELTQRVTADNRVLDLNICLNYGSRREILQAVKSLAEMVVQGELSPRSIDEKKLRRQFYLPDLPDVDLFLRSSGEQRLSNFLLWQSAYAELVFMETLWPDFRREHLWEAIGVYLERNRRFGKA